MLTDFIVIQSRIFIFGCSCTVHWLNKLHFPAKCFACGNKTEKEYVAIYCGIMATTTHVQPITRSDNYLQRPKLSVDAA